MASLQEEHHPEYEKVGEGTLRGAALGSRDAEIHDGQVRKTEDSFGRIGAGQIKTSCKVEEEPSSLPSVQSSTQGSLPSAKEESTTKDPEDSSSEVTRDIGNLKVSYTTEDDPQPPHRSTLQKIKDKISDKEHKLKSGKERPGLNSSFSGGGDHVHENKPGLLTRLKHKVWKTQPDSGRPHTDPTLGPEDVAAADSEASSGSDTSASSSTELSSSSERRPSATGTGADHRSAGEAIIKQPSSPSHGREHMATPPSLDEGALPSSELSTGYEEDTEAPRRADPDAGHGQLENAAPAHGHPKWAPYKEDVTSGPPGDGGAPAAPLSAPAGQDRVSAQEDVPPLEEVKAPGMVDRLKEEVAAVGETVQEKIGLKADDKKGTLVPDSSGNKDRQEEETTGILGRFAQRTGLAGSAASHGRSQST